MGAGANPRARLKTRIRPAITRATEIVDAIGDLAIMHQRVSCDPAEPCARRLIVDDLRLFGDIAAGHYHRALHPRQNQEMQRRRRQHEAQGCKTGGDLVRHLLCLVGLEQHDRRRRADERPLLLRSHRTIAPDDVEISRHQSEWLRVAAFQPAQAHNGSGVGRVTREMKAADAFDGNDFARSDEPAYRIDIIEHRMLVETRRPAVEADERRPRPASVAGDRFGVETAVGGVAIFALARLAHRKRRHCRVGAIVGDALDDAETRPAMRAIGEGITEATLKRIDDFLGAGRADRGVRRDLSVRVARKTLGDPKFGRQRAGEGASFDPVNPRQRRRFALQANDEILDRA